MKENQRDEQGPQVRKLRLIKGGLWVLTPNTAPAAGHRIPKLKLVEEHRGQVGHQEATGRQARRPGSRREAEGGGQHHGWRGPDLTLACAAGRHLKEAAITKVPTITS